MKSTTKMSGHQRRAAIVEAVGTVFAEKGFHATTTRQLAEAAGVSEALLFKHFPSKEAIYHAMLEACLREEDTRLIERLDAMPPSTATLVLLVHLLLCRMLLGPPPGGQDHTLMNRLMLRSLMEDGEFARVASQGRPLEWVQKVEACIEAAVAAGDLADGSVLPRLGGLFALHLGAMLMIHLLPERPIFDYGVSREELIDQSVWFVLRGMGLTDEAIRRHYDPRALAKFANGFAAGD
jgi:AcrR family transcriptional regulator